MNPNKYEEMDRKVKRAQGGHSEAVKELYTDFVPLMKASVRKYGGAFLSAEDLFQTAATEFLLALRDYDFETGVPFPAFLKSRLRYALLNETRRLEKLRRECSLDLPNEEGETWGEQMPSGEPTPEERLISKEDHQKLLKLLQTLSEKERELFQRYYQEKKTLRKIAEETGEKLSTLKLRKRRAEEKLKERWNQDENIST